MKNWPSFIYGTAWKKDATTGLVVQALHSGFKAIDTANQPKHYSEALSGDALALYLKEGGKRTDLFIQTKFTPSDGQDSRMPYDPRAGLPDQVHQSFTSSLEHLKTDYVDSYILHAPLNFPDIGPEDLEVWDVFEELHDSKKARAIGVSNINALQLKHLYEKSRVKPMTIQNRCYANRGWDKDVRNFCKAQGIVYQGFSLLTANPGVLSHPRVAALGEKYKKTQEQIIFRFCRQIGILPLTGTSNPEHMKEDLDIDDFQLTEPEMRLIECVSLP